MDADAEGALWVGTSDELTTYYSTSTQEQTITRASYFDDRYIFFGDGEFKNEFDNETWVEPWQSGVDTEGVGAPVSPHDGSTPSTWTYNGDSTFTINGAGNFVGLAKVFNNGEISNPDGTTNPVPESITYTIQSVSEDDTHKKMVVTILIAPGVIWRYKLKQTKVVPPSPIPTDSSNKVISIFSDIYDNLVGTEFNPNWGQTTQVTVDNILTYSNLNYQGTNFTATDVSQYEYFHVDFYTTDATILKIFVIKSGGDEIGYDLTNQIVLNSWVSVNIPLSVYEGVVDLTGVNQLKVEGNGNVLLDNLYFGKSV